MRAHGLKVLAVSAVAGSCLVGCSGLTSDFDPAEERSTGKVSGVYGAWIDEPAEGER